MIFEWLHCWSLHHSQRCCCCCCSRGKFVSLMMVVSAWEPRRMWAIKHTVESQTLFRKNFVWFPWHQVVRSVLQKVDTHKADILFVSMASISRLLSLNFRWQWTNSEVRGRSVRSIWSRTRDRQLNKYPKRKDCQHLRTSNVQEGEGYQLHLTTFWSKLLDLPTDAVTHTPTQKELNSWST